jgi:hypothetical protein
MNDGVGDDEVVVRLANGWTLRSGDWGSGRVSGDYVRLVDENGVEYLYYDCEEWAEAPQEVIGAIMNAAAGRIRLKVRVPCEDHPSCGGPDECCPSYHWEMP